LQEYNYRLARIDAKTKTITDIADLSIEKDTQMNIKQKRIKTELREISLLTHSPCCRSFFDFKGVTEGLLWKRKTKNKTRRNRRIGKGNPKKGIGKIKRNTIYNLSDLFIV
jgi:hypothetical protein